MHVPTAKIIDGIAVSAKIRAECKRDVANLARHRITPGLAVVLVGSDPASAVYVRNKIRACAEVGIKSFQYDFPTNVEPDVVLATIHRLNEDPGVHGILVQLPLPSQFATGQMLRAISAEKDVDGFHLYNVGGLVVGDTVFPPCTPYGVVKLLLKARMSLSSAPRTSWANPWRSCSCNRMPQSASATQKRAIGRQALGHMLRSQEWSRTRIVDPFRNYRPSARKRFLAHEQTDVTTRRYLLDNFILGHTN